MNFRVQFNYMSCHIFPDFLLPKRAVVQLMMKWLLKAGEGRENNNSFDLFFVSSGSVEFFFLKTRSHGAMYDCVFLENRNYSHIKWVCNLFKYDVAHHTQKCIAVTPSEHLQKPLHNIFHAIKLITVANKQTNKQETHRVNESWIL